MSNHILNIETKAQNGLRDLMTRVNEGIRNDDGEIGSQLILMAILVGAALAALTPIRDAISGLVDKITGGVNEADV